MYVARLMLFSRARCSIFQCCHREICGSASVFTRQNAKLLLYEANEGYINKVQSRTHLIGARCK